MFRIAAQLRASQLDAAPFSLLVPAPPSTPAPGRRPPLGPHARERPRHGLRRRRLRRRPPQPRPRPRPPPPPGLRHPHGRAVRRRQSQVRRRRGREQDDLHRRRARAARECSFSFMRLACEFGTIVECWRRRTQSPARSPPAPRLRAGGGTMCMEFGLLSRLTGDTRFEARAAGWRRRRHRPALLLLAPRRR